MRELSMDGRHWNSRDGFYDAFFEAVGAPSWHGRNFNALNDSIGTGNINEIEVPYCLVIQNYDLIPESTGKIADDFIDLIRSLKARGCDVDIRIERSKQK